MNPKYEAFVKAVETGSFKQSAADLGYTQAGISYLINALEKDMGTALLIRSHAGVRPTPDGEALLPWIQEVCNSERALQTRLDEVRHIEGGTIRIASFTSVAVHWLPGIISRFLDDHPQVEFESVCYEEQEAQELACWRGDFDCAFVVTPTKLDFHTISLAQDPLAIVVAPDHPLAQGGVFPAWALGKESYIKVRNDTHTEMDTLFENHGVEPNVRFEVDNDYAVMGMVAQGLGFGVFSQLILRDTPFDLVALKPEIPLERQLGIAVRSLDKASIATKAFIECTRSWVAENEKNSDGTVPSGSDIL